MKLMKNEVFQDLEGKGLQRKNKKKPVIKQKISEIQEILKQIKQKKVKEAPKKREVKKEEETEFKEKKKTAVDVDYQRNKSLYEQQAKPVDYNKLFEYLGKEREDPYQFYISMLKETAQVELTEEQLERIIKREQVNLMVRNNLDQPDIDEKEKFKYWRACNRLMSMIKIELARVGEGAASVFYV